MLGTAKPGAAVSREPWSTGCSPLPKSGPEQRRRGGHCLTRAGQGEGGVFAFPAAFKVGSPLRTGTLNVLFCGDRAGGRRIPSYKWVSKFCIQGNCWMMLSDHWFAGSIPASLVAQMVKNLPAVQETRFCLWVGKIPWRRKWQPTPVFLPEESHGQRSLVGCSP